MNTIEELGPGDEIEFLERPDESWTVISLKKDKISGVLGSDRPNNGGAWFNNTDSDFEVLKEHDTIGKELATKFHGKAAKILLRTERFRILKRNRSNLHLDYPHGLKCDGCREHYPYAIPNQPDMKTLVCYSCRENPIRRYY